MVVQQLNGKREKSPDHAFIFISFQRSKVEKRDAVKSSHKWGLYDVSSSGTW